ncbi:hypothetical protein BDY19DRAFT_902468 [Irpex rosettiformis]|uniref:Uncharacterized protein n=1 Tax=Irpex rosettiformis TaxID=378272 RepID=A0ACB8UHG8_9APHY|nr:hypothetical protein BDY19DRAFT_902468 [Irpex rosettiformis]
MFEQFSKAWLCVRGKEAEEKQGKGQGGVAPVGGDIELLPEYGTIPSLEVFGNLMRGMKILSHTVADETGQSGVQNSSGAKKMNFLSRNIYSKQVRAYSSAVAITSTTATTSQDLLPVNIPLLRNISAQCSVLRYTPCRCERIGEWEAGSSAPERGVTGLVANSWAGVDKKRKGLEGGVAELAWGRRM